MPYGVGLSVASQLIDTYTKDTFSQFRSTGPEGEEAAVIHHHDGLRRTPLGVNEPFHRRRVYAFR